VALFVLVVAALVVAQTWLDWRDTRKDWVVPEWAKGLALAGCVAALLTAATSFASFWIQDPTNASNSTFNSAMFWPELGFLLCANAVIIVAVRKKRLRLMLLLTGILTAAFWIGLTIS
jgi:hypothetical protein